MKQTLKDCTDLTICNQTDLMTNWVFITKEVYKENCSKDCVRKSTCWAIIDLLLAWKFGEAIDLLKNNK